MGTKTEKITVCPVTVFKSNYKFFWFTSIEHILESYPLLEQPHKQLYYTLLFVECGVGVAVVDNKTIRLDEPKVICIKPNSVFSLDINRTAKGYIICFTEEFFSLRYNNNVLSQFALLHKESVESIRLDAKHTSRLNTILNLMQDELRSSSKGVEKVIRSYLNIILFNLEKRFSNKNLSPNLNGKNEKMMLFEKLVEGHFATEKAPSWYAKQLNITTNYLNKLCKSNKNETSGDVIKKRVIIEAQRQLHYTTLSVAEIAYKLGFETPSYFITFFKKNTGETPESFRKHTY